MTGAASPRTRASRMLLAAVGLVVVAGLLSPGAAFAGLPPDEPAPPASLPRSSAVAVPPQQLVADAGYRIVDGKHVLAPVRLVTVARLSATTGRTAEQRVLDVRLRVVPPTRLATSVRAWCHPWTAAPQAEPGADVLGRPLLIGQNPYPGGDPVAVASRTLQGRVPLLLPASTAVSCEVQLSPRTEGATASTMAITSGTVALSALPVSDVGVFPLQTLVGHGPGATPSAVRVVSVTTSTRPESVRRVEADVSVTNCYAGYRTCSVEGPRTATVAATAVLVRRLADGRVCRVVRGPTTVVAVSIEMHHRRVVLAPALDTTAGSCGTSVTGFLEVRPVSGNSVEVDGQINGTGVKTVVWLERRG